MKNEMTWGLILLMSAVSGCSKGRSAPIGVQNLRCEYLINPLGIGERRPRLSWILESPQRGQKQTAYRILVSSTEAELEKDVGDLWDTGKVSGDRTNQIEYGGRPLISRQRCYWKVQSWDKEGRPSRFSAPAFWTVGLLDPQDWKAGWIRADRRSPEAQPKPLAPGPPPPYFRTEFEVQPNLRRATVYATARGLFELGLNGIRVGDDVFPPEWTDYNRRIQYRTYDVTELLHPGKNALGAVVADGWFSGYVGWRKFRGNYGMENSLMLQMELDYADGTRASIVTDETWRWAEGPIRSADLLMGQHTDARLDMPGWDAPDFDASAWRPVQIAEPTGAELVAQASPPVRIIAEITPTSVKEPRPGIFVFDLGQNIAGWARLKVRGRTGDRIELRYSERLNPDGTIYTANLRDAKATDIYICQGGEPEVFEPRFTFHGFQYIEVTGFPGPPDLDAVTGCALASSCPETGVFQCSHPMVNRLFSNLLWSQRANYISVPTDCPQRDERLGWMGDAQIFVRTGSFNMDTAAFFTKWMQDVVDAQSPEGAFPDFAPRLNDKVLMGFEAAPAWGDAGIIIPWTIYRVYDDTRIIQRQWEAMERWMDFLHRTNPDLIRRREVGNNYGDWLSIQADTPKDLLATAYWAWDALLMARMAAVIDREKESAAYAALFREIRRIFQEEFVLEDGHIKGETQTGWLLALAMDLLPENLRHKAAEHLVADIRARNGHLSTGFVGCAHLLPVLADTGHAATAFGLLLNDTFPSWGYSIKHGATSIWERWDGWTEERGFQDPGMNSFNHYAFGAVGEWLYRYVAGIDLDEEISGYARFRIRPFIGGGLEWARAEYDSIRGKIISGWSLREGRIILEVRVPPNTSAEVHLHCTDRSEIQEGENPADRAEGVMFLRREGERTVYAVASGTYRFNFPLSRE